MLASGRGVESPGGLRLSTLKRGKRYASPSAGGDDALPMEHEAGPADWLTVERVSGPMRERKGS
jgi:hypothetical protein